MMYFDNAATTQIAPQVLADMIQYERDGRGNPHRGLHTFAERATKVLESARTRVSSFIGGDFDELIFTKGTTESLNLALYNLTRGLGKGDEVVYTIFDHHATLLPLLERAKEQGFTLRVIGTSVFEKGQTGVLAPKAILEEAREAISPKTKLLVFPHVSNVTGTILPAKELTSLAKSMNAKVLIDGAQAVGHMPVNVKDIGCDAYAFSAHKMYGPMGIGALYVKKEELESWKPIFYGGGMIEEIVDAGGLAAPSPYSEGANKIDVRYLSGPRLFEAGTPNVTGALGFAGACNYVEGIGRKEIQKREGELVKEFVEGLRLISTIRVFKGTDTGVGPYGEEYAAVVSFAVANMHPHDVAQALSDKGIAVRAGYHCAAPLSKALNPAGTVRVSFSATSTKEEIDILLEALKAL